MSPRDDRLPTSNSSIVQWFKLDQFVPERAVTSHFISSKALLYLRIPLVLYSTIALWADIGISLATNEFHHYFAYFTRFTFVGLNAYLIVSNSKILSLWRSLDTNPTIPPSLPSFYYYYNNYYQWVFPTPPLIFLLDNSSPILIVPYGRQPY